jgi:transcription factor TGA
MNSTSTHFVPPRRVGIYEPVHQFGMWGESFKSNISNGTMNTPNHIIIPNNQKLDNNVVLFYFIALQPPDDKFVWSVFRNLN